MAFNVGKLQDRISKCEKCRGQLPRTTCDLNQSTSDARLCDFSTSAAGKVAIA